MIEIAVFLLVFVCGILIGKGIESGEALRHWREGYEACQLKFEQTQPNGSVKAQ